MNSVGHKAWIVATGIGCIAVVAEALKDQGFARWNPRSLRSIYQHGKNKIMMSYAQAKKFSAPSSSAFSEKSMQQRRKKLEESHRKIMELNCWGPECTRF